MTTDIPEDQSLVLRLLARALATQQGASGVVTREVLDAKDVEPIAASLKGAEALFEGGLIDGVEMAEESFPVRVTRITPEGRAVLRALRQKDRDSVLVALYEATGGDTMLDMSRKELVQLLRIPYADFSAAEDLLLDQSLVSGTMGGIDGTISLTSDGVVKAEEILDVESEMTGSPTTTNNVPGQLLDVLEAELKAMEREPWSSTAKGWKLKAMDVLKRIGVGDDLVRQIENIDFSPYEKPQGVQFAPSGWEEIFEQAKADALQVLEATRFRLELNKTLAVPASVTVTQNKGPIFIGHGGSPLWRELKDFISDRLRLDVDEFSRVATAGVHTSQRLEEMLQSASMAFLVMTAEDELAGGAMTPRLNVVHEAGLFQGRLGFRKAIVLLEDGCQEFSNIHGLGQIRFPKGDISAKFEEVRRVLEREGILDSV